MSETRIASRLVGRALVLCVACLSLSVDAATTYYIDFVGGNDANNGLSKVAAKKRHPFMAGYSGPAYSHSAGDQFIFKGGTTWPRSCFQMRVNQGGSSSSVRDYYGTDQTWYSGGSWTSPIFDAEASVIGGATAGAQLLVSESNLTFDGIEFIRVAGTSQQNGAMNIVMGGTFLDNITITNCVFRDWVIVQSNGTPYTGGTGWDSNGVGGVGILFGNWGGGILITHCTAYQTTQKSGCSFRQVPDVRYSEVYATTQAVLGGYSVRFCRFHDMPDPTDLTAHNNAIEIFGPAYIYGNIIYRLSSFTAPILIAADWGGRLPTSTGAAGGTPIPTIIANNVLWECGGQIPIGLDTGGNPTESIYRVYNNTADNGTSYCVVTADRGAPPYKEVDIRNNHFITTGDSYFLDGPVTTFTESSNLKQTPTVATSFGYTSGNEYQPIDGTKPTVGAGLDFSASFTTDAKGVTRAAPWDLGAYEFVSGGGGSPGVLTLSSPTYSVAEDGGTVTITAKRSGGTTGAVGVGYATANGTATAGVNYTSTSGTFSWGNGDGADKTVDVPITDASTYGNQTFSFTISSPTGGATLTTPTSATVTIVGSGDPPPAPILSGLSWPAPDGEIAPPFTVTGSYISQASETVVADGGIATYRFTNAPGNYNFYMTVVATNDGMNSVYFKINGTPEEPGDVFDVVTLTGASPVERIVSRRGVGTYLAPEEPSFETFLEGGVTNVLTIVGREANMRIYNVEARLIVAADDPATVVNVTALNPDGYYKAGVVITNIVRFSTNVTVTGSPALVMSTGASATYSSGSGSTNLLFLYTVSAGQTSADLDYADTDSLQLSGGTIQNDGVDATLTLPAPGAPGSLGNNKAIVIDTTRPTITISSPSESLAGLDGASFSVDYSDLNFFLSNLTTNDITVNTTGDAAGTLILSSPSFLTHQTVDFSQMTGDGTIGITIGANTGSDLAGNLTLGAGPSATFTVDTTSPTVSISSPSVSSTSIGPVSFVVTYADAHFSSSTLSSGNVTVNSTGTAAAGSVGVSGSGTTRTVTLSSITGEGTLGISLAAGTASDTVGNLAPATGPSTTFNVVEPDPTPTPPGVRVLSIQGTIEIKGTLRIAE